MLEFHADCFLKLKTTLTNAFSSRQQETNKESLRVLPSIHCGRQEEESKGSPQNPWQPLSYNRSVEKHQTVTAKVVFVLM